MECIWFCEKHINNLLPKSRNNIKLTLAFKHEITEK
ncbi:hypothetical protein [Lederbergia lenta]